MLVFCYCFVQESELNETQVQEQEKPSSPSNQTPCPDEEDMLVDQAPKEPVPNVDTGAPSFAPEGFVFQAPVGLSSFKFEPLTPRSADAFLTPRSVFPFTYLQFLFKVFGTLDGFQVMSCFI